MARTQSRPWLSTSRPFQHVASLRQTDRATETIVSTNLSVGRRGLRRRKSVLRSSPPQNRSVARLPAGPRRYFLPRGVSKYLIYN